jgi:hypothetical protein
MQKRVRFTSLEIGEEFEWAGRFFKKIGDHRAVYTGVPQEQSIFNGGEIVISELPELKPIEEDDDDNLFSQTYLDWHGYP